MLVDLHVWKGEHFIYPPSSSLPTLARPPLCPLTSISPPSGLGTWILPPHDDANGPVYFRREVRTRVRTAGSAIHDADVPMPWDVDLCWYHVHDDTAVCERKGSLVVESQLGPGSAMESTSDWHDCGASFECAPCNKLFPSASALGGHKASPGHKKKAKNWITGAAK